jgi:YD repeat-containing protein
VIAISPDSCGWGSIAHFVFTRGGEMIGRVIRGFLLVAGALAAFSAIPATAADTTYKYDATGRLIEVEYASGMRVIYVYDRLGNRIAVRASTSTSNTAPTVTNDTISTPMGVALVFDARDNDYDLDGDGLTVTAVGTPSHGSASITGYKVTYTPTWPYAGSDSFSYTVSDGTTTTNGTVNVTVSEPTPTQLTGSYTASSQTGFSGGGMYFEDTNDYPGYSTYYQWVFGTSNPSDGPTWFDDAVFYSMSGPYVWCSDWIEIFNEIACTEFTYDYVPVGGTFYTLNNASPWVQVDLGATKLIDQVEIIQWNGNQSAATVEYSTNGTSWTSVGTVASHSAASWAALEDATGTFVTKSFGKVDARYIRVKDSGTDRLVVTGFKVYGWEQP